MDCIIFTVAVDEFDANCFCVGEHPDDKQMLQSAALFGELCIATDIFDECCGIVLLLNKVDRLAARLADGDEPVMPWPGYTGGRSVTAALEFITNQFLANAHGRNVKVHKTTAIDKDDVSATVWPWGVIDAMKAVEGDSPNRREEEPIDGGEYEAAVRREIERKKNLVCGPNSVCTVQ